MSTLFSGHYLRNRSTLDIDVLGYIGIVQHKEHSPDVFHIPPGTHCIYIYISCCVHAEFLFKKNYSHSLKQFLTHFNMKYTNFVICIFPYLHCAELI